MSGGSRSTPDQQTAPAAGVSHAVGFGSETGSTAPSEGGSVARIEGDRQSRVKPPQSVLDALADAETLRLFARGTKDAALYDLASAAALGGIAADGHVNYPQDFARSAAHHAFLAVPNLRYPDLSPTEAGIDAFYSTPGRVEFGD